MNECQVWWTITGNFGNMMPIDWSNSTTRAKHLHTLNLNAKGGRRRSGNKEEDMAELEEDDDIIAADLDMHSLILRNSNPHENSVSESYRVEQKYLDKLYTSASKTSRIGLIIK